MDSRGTMMMKGARRLLRKTIGYSLAVLFFAATLAGCASIRAYMDMDANLIGASYTAADKLVSRMNPPISPNQPVLVASFVNIDNLEQTSGLGRTISEQIAARVNQRGYKVIEMKLRKTIFVSNSRGGQFMLSRELRNISAEHNIQYVVVGTYSVASSIIYVSAAVVNPVDNMLLATYNYELPLGSNNRVLLEMN
jgi:TolB-like protein